MNNPGARGPGANILGYLTMLVLLQGLMHMALYSDDKEKQGLQADRHLARTSGKLPVCPWPVQLPADFCSDFWRSCALQGDLRHKYRF